MYKILCQKLSYLTGLTGLTHSEKLRYLQIDFITFHYSFTARLAADQ